MKIKTAVEWLKEKIKETYDKEGKLPLAYILDLVRQAKELEKEQIIDAYCDGSNTRTSGEEYYKEAYESNTNL